MKPLFFLFALLLVPFSAARPQETFAPLIKEGTILFAHIDLRKMDVDRLKTDTAAAVEQFLRHIQFDAPALKAVRRELDAELKKLDETLLPAYLTITKELGIKEAAVIYDQNLCLCPDFYMPLLVLPWKEKTENDLKKIRTVFKDSEFIKLIPVAGYLFISMQYAILQFDGDPVPLPKEEQEALTAWFKTETAKEHPLIDAIQSLNKNDEIKFAAALSPSVKEKLAAEARTAHWDSMSNVLVFMSKKIDWMAASFAIPRLQPATQLPAREEVPARGTSALRLLTVKTSKPSDARQLRLMLDGFIDWSIFAARLSQVIEGEDGVDIPPLAWHFIKGMLRTALPDVEEDKLVFRWKPLRLSRSTLTAVAGVAAAAAVPSILQAREAAKRTVCRCNLRSIIEGIHVFSIRNADDKGEACLPALYTAEENGKPLHSWRVLILPYIGQKELYNKIRLDEPWDSKHNRQFHNADIPEYRCPCGSAKPGECCYAAVAGEGLIPARMTLTETGKRVSEITDGEQTLAIVEVKKPFCWMNPEGDVPLAELRKGINTGGRVGSNHPGGIHVARFDGYVYFLKENTPPKTLEAMGTAAGGETVEGEFPMPHMPFRPIPMPLPAEPEEGEFPVPHMPFRPIPVPLPLPSELEEIEGNL